MSQVSISLESGTVRVILTVFGVLVALVALGFVLKAFAAPFEIGLSVSLHDFFESGPVWGVSAAISSYMTYAVLGGFAVLIAYPRTRRLGICLGIQVLITWFFQEFVIKNIVLRPRPYVYLDIPSPLKQMSDFTYFSGHSQTVLSIAGFFWNHRRRIQIVFIAVGLFVMLTRIIVYAHYLSDVTVGALFGFAGGMFFYLWASGRLGLKWIPHLSLDQSDADGRRSAVGQRYNHARRFTPMALKPEFEKLFADHAAGPKYFALATSSKAGVPNVVPIGFLWVENGEIRVVDNYLNKTLANIRENPIVAVYAMGGETGKECIQVKGKAVYEDSGPEFEAAYKRAKAKNEKYPAKGLVRIFPEHVYNTSPGPTAGDEIH